MNLSQFKELKKTLGGMLDPAVYYKYYVIAKEHSRGSIIELGAGQGASTAALALGLRDSGRKARLIAVDQFSQHGTGGPHPASISVDGSRASELNYASFKKNLRRYGVENLVDIYVGRTDEVNVDEDALRRCDMMVIDLDGMLDRDFGVFYDYIADGGIIVIDDYRDSVNGQGREAIDRYSRLKLDEMKKRLQRLDSYKRRRLLGKHMLTYRLVRLFKKRGLLEPFDLLHNTVFCRKSSGMNFSARVAPEDVMAVERSIVHDFQFLVKVKNRRPVEYMLFLTKNFIRKLGKFLKYRLYGRWFG